TDSDFPMSSITGRAKKPITTSIGRGIQLEIKITMHAYAAWFCIYSLYFFTPRRTSAGAA
ncbi:hypothetical protein, partial [Cedecea sp. NFIX57]|uniref:hypothetical protein n=1 Tax=Cedecea sp. NFIX57 TaxID=1566286 RepID=UPI00111BEFF4